MTEPTQHQRLERLIREHRELLARTNEVDPSFSNGLCDRYRFPVLTAAHTPIFWRYDLDLDDNPFLLERLGINAVFNAGAIEHAGKILVVCRVEGVDRKSFFAVAESANGIDRFRFWDYPILLPETDDPDINVYDMRLVRHEDGHVYGLFCTERKDPAAPPGDTSSAIEPRYTSARSRTIASRRSTPKKRRRHSSRRSSASRSRSRIAPRTSASRPAWSTRRRVSSSRKAT